MNLIDKKQIAQIHGFTPRSIDQMSCYTPGFPKYVKTVFGTWKRLYNADEIDDFMREYKENKYKRDKPALFAKIGAGTTNELMAGFIRGTHRLQANS